MAGLIGAKNSGLAILAFVETIKSFDVMDMDALTDEQYRAHQYQEASIRQSLAFAILNAQINLEGKVNRKAAASVARHFKGILDGQEGVVTVGFTNTGSGVARHTAPEYGTSKYKETSKLYNLHSSTLTNPEFWQDLLSRHDHESPDSVYRLLSANHISQENAEKVGILEALNLRADLLVPISSTGHAMMLQLAPRPAELVLEASLATHKLQEGSTCWVESLKQAQYSCQIHRYRWTQSIITR